MVPTTDVAQYSEAQHGLPVTIHLYPGKDANFCLYEDAGDGNDTNFSTILFQWDDTNRSLLIGARQGKFDGMLKERTFIVQMADGTTRTITYNGKQVKLSFRM